MSSDQERPIRVIWHADGFMGVDDEDCVGIGAMGPGALESLARQLFDAGFDPDRELVLFRGERRAGSVTIGQAAGVDGP